MNLIKQIAAMIFVSGDEGVSLDSLSSTLGLEEQVIEAALNDLKTELELSTISPVTLVNYNQRYYFVTLEELASTIEEFAQNPLNQKLSRAAIETLAIIAYRQPITRLAIDEIRGVSSQNMVKKLVQRGLVQSLGYMEGPGKPHLYGVTQYFMEYFGLETLSDLPEVKPLELHPEQVSENLFKHQNIHYRQETWLEEE